MYNKSVVYVKQIYQKKCIFFYKKLLNSLNIKEIAAHDDPFYKLYDRLPKEMAFIRELLVSNLWRQQDLGLATPRPAEKVFEETKELEAHRAVPDKAAATAE